MVTGYVIIFLLLLSAAVTLSLIIYSRQYYSPISLPYQLLMAFITLWSLNYTLQLLTPVLLPSILIHDTRFLIIPYVPIIILWMFLTYIDKQNWFSRYTAGVLLVIPVITSILALTSSYQTLFRYNYHVIYEPPLSILQFDTGIWYWVYILYSYSLVIAAIILLLYFGDKSQPKFRKQIYILGFMQIFSLTLDSLLYTPLNPIHGINLTPVLFCLVGIIYYVAIIRYGFIDLIPIARSRIIESISSPIFVLNDSGKIIDINPAVERIIGSEKKPTIGRNILDVIPDSKELTDFILSDSAETIRISKPDDNKVTTYLGKIDFITSPSGSYLGRIIKLDDISDQVEFEKVILQSESRFRQLADATIEGIIIHKDGIILDLNKQACDLFGYTREELIEKSALILSTLEYKSLIEERLKNQDITPFIAKGLRKDGSEFWGEIYSRIFYSGNEALCIAAIWNITERHRNEEYNYALSSLMQQLLSDKPLEVKLLRVTDTLVKSFGAELAGIWIIRHGDLCKEGCIHASDSTGTGICKDNSSCLHLVASSGMNTNLYGAYSRIPLGTDQIGRIAGDEENCSIIDDIIRDNGISDTNLLKSHGITSFSGFKLNSSDGKPIGVLAFFCKNQDNKRIKHFFEELSDITSMIIQKGITEKALEESEIKFYSIFRETPDVIILLSADLRILDVNQKWEEIFGYSSESIYLLPLMSLKIAQNQKSLEELLKNSGTSKEIINKEITLISKKGIPFVSELTISTIMIRGNPCIMLQIHDIDEIRRAYDAVAQVNNKLKILSSITRHDILNRVMVTSAYSNIIMGEIKDEKLKKSLEAIYQSSSEIQALIEFTAHYQDLGETTPSWQNINQIMNKHPIEGLLKGIAYTSTLGDLNIYADPMLEKVMYNLVENSVRHGKKLTIIKLSSHEEAGDMIILYEDDGGGIIEDEKEKVFNKGFGKNTGLGLFLIREILSITGITIIENGVPGTGVRFEIRVPPGRYLYAYKQ